MRQTTTGGGGKDSSINEMPKGCLLSYLRVILKVSSSWKHSGCFEA